MQDQWSITRRSALKTLATSGGMAVSALLPTRPTLPAEKAGDRQSLVDRLRDPLVPISTAFKDDDSMDLKSTAEWVDWLIKQGIKLFWTTEGTPRYYCISDRELNDLNQSVAEVTRGRAVFVAGAPRRYNTAHCIQFSERAAKWGADIVMIQTHWSRHPNADQAFEHHRAVAEASPLPLFCYSVPGFPTGFLQRILELPKYVGMKNDSGDFEPQSNFLRTIRQSGRTFVPMTGGTLRPYLYARHFGSQAFADLLLAGLEPKIVLDFSRYLDKANYEEAVGIIQKYEEPIMEAFAPLGSHACFRACRWIKGLAHSPRDRFPEKTLDEEGSRRMRELLERLELL